MGNGGSTPQPYVQPPPLQKCDNSGRRRIAVNEITSLRNDRPDLLPTDVFCFKVRPEPAQRVARIGGRGLYGDDAPAVRHCNFFHRRIPFLMLHKKMEPKTRMRTEALGFA